MVCAMSNVGGWSREVSVSVTVGVAARGSIVVVAVCAGTVGGVGLEYKKRRLLLAAVGEVHRKHVCPKLIWNSTLLS